MKAERPRKLPKKPSKCRQCPLDVTRSCQEGTGYRMSLGGRSAGLRGALQVLRRGLRIEGQRGEKLGCFSRDFNCFYVTLEDLQSSFEAL